MELKSINFIVQWLLLLSSNRTFMELKYDDCWTGEEGGAVLIAPLWN